LGRFLNQEGFSWCLSNDEALVSNISTGDIADPAAVDFTQLRHPKTCDQCKTQSSLLYHQVDDKVEEIVRPPPLPNKEHQTSHMTFKQYIKSLPHVYRRTIGVLKGCSYSRILSEYLRIGELIAAGNVTVDNRRGAHSYILEKTDEKWKMVGKAPVDSDPDDMSSNRAEGCSVVAMITLLVAIYKIYSLLDDGEVEVFCGNAEAMQKKYCKNVTYTKTAQREMDINMEIAYLLKLTNMKVCFQHVKGHADDDEDFEYDQAPQPTRRNIDMDKSAKAFLSNPPLNFCPNMKPGIFFHQKIALYLHDTLITGD